MASVRLPPRQPSEPVKLSAPLNPDDWLSWTALILPELEQSALWTEAMNAFAAGVFPAIDPPHRGNSTVLMVLVCPSEGRGAQLQLNPLGQARAYTSYLGVGGGWEWDGVLGRIRGRGRIWAEVTDGLSNTLMVGERPAPDSFQAGQWYLNAVYGPEDYFRGPDAVWPMRGPNIALEPCHHLGGFRPGRFDDRCDRFHFWSMHSSGGNFLFADGSVRFLPYATSPAVMLALASMAGGETATPH